MLLNDTELQPVNCITDAEQQSIMTYLQGAVYCWCKNCKEANGENRWFAARNLVGGENTHWEATPLAILSTRLGDETKAGQELGKLLKRVLYNDPRRTFETKAGTGKQDPRKYRWIGNDDI